MEEDIKTIENIIDTLKFHIEYENYEENILDECKRDIKALENLLKRYKELKEENKELEKTNSSIKYLNEGLRLDKNILTDMVNDLQEQKRNSIPISVIENELDELDKKIAIAQGEELIIFEAKEDVLQELLKRKE